MRTTPRLALALLLSLTATAAARALPVCGFAIAADGSALPPAARAELLPMERSYAWELAVLAGRDPSEPAATDGLESGRYCLEAPAAGLWKLVVRSPGFVPMARFPLAVTAPLDLPPVRLSRDEGVRVALGTGGEGPRGEAWVVAGSADRSFWTGRGGDGWRPDLRFARVGADGRARLPRAPGEALSLEALAGGSAATAGVRVEAPQRSVRLDLPRPEVRRTVVVVDERGEALAGVAVALADHGWPVGLTDEHGRFVLRFAAGATVGLLLEAEDGRRRITRLPAVPEEAGAAAAEAPLRIELPPTPPVRGRVLDGEGRKGLLGALVWLAQDPGTHTVAGPEGAYALPGGGRDRLRVEAAAAEYLSRAVAVDGADLAAGRAQDLVLQPAGAVFGRVVDAEGSPLAAVTLEAVPQEADRSRPPGAVSRARSGSDGRFRLPGLRPAVAYQVVASREGFVSRTLPGVMLPPGRRTADLGTVVLRPGARLEGRAVDGRGRPIEGAEVRIREAGGLPVPAAEERLRERPPDAVSGSDGRFVLPDLAPGRPLDLLSSRRGYLPEWTLGVEIPAPEPLTVVLADASRLSGSLVDQDGVPIPHAPVGMRWARPPAGTVGLEPLRPGSRSTETGARGEFSFEELTPGQVELFSRPDGFLPGESTAITLPAGGEVTGVRLVLARGAVVAGRVFGPDGGPVAGAELRVESATTLSAAEGAFRLEGVPPGQQVLYAYHPDYRRQVRELHVEPGDNAVDLYLEDGWSVSGRTVDEAGRAVAGARVELRPDRADAVTGYRTTSDADGGFRIVVFAEGTFRATATHDGYAPGEVGGLEVRASSLDGVEVTLSRGLSVVGRILGLQPEELAGVTIAARREGASEEDGEVGGGVDLSGRFAVEHLAPGDWRIQGELDGGRRHAAVTVTLDGATREVSRDLEFGSGLRLTGRLLYAGDPIAGAHVLLSGLTATGDRSVLSGHDGAFRIDDLAPGRYRLDVLDRSRALSYVQDLELFADRDLLLELESAPLVGTVTASDSGEPLDDAMVIVRRVLAASGDTGPLIAVATDPTGAFVVAHLTPGDYLVSARKDGYAPAEQPLRVEAGVAPSPALLRLAPTGGVTLTVHLESGGVPRMATVSAFDGSGHLLVNDTRRVSDRGFVYFGQIPAGVWNLLVSAPGAAPAWVTAEVPGSNPEVVLPPAAPLVVRVPALMQADATGTLTVAGENGDPFFQVDPTGEIQSQWTLSAGLVTLSDVPAGIWSLRVDGAQGETWLGTVVTDGRTPSQVNLE